MPNKNATSASGDALAVLRRDHQLVEQLFRRFERARGAPERRRVGDGERCEPPVAGSAEVDPVTRAAELDRVRDRVREHLQDAAALAFPGDLRWPPPLMRTIWYPSPPPP